MLPSSSRTVEMYETLGMTPEEIAADASVDVLAVKAILTRHSPMYKQLLPKDEKKALFSGDLLLAAAETMESLLEEDDPTVKFRAAKFIIDEVKGRNDAMLKHMLGNNAPQININVINMQLARSRAAIAAAKNSKPLEQPKEEYKEGVTIDA
jgi:hypothetical protein